MKINQFIEIAAKKGWMPITVNDQDQKIKTALEVKSYLGIKEKKTLVESIIEDTIIYDNGLYKFQPIDQYVTYTMFTIQAYTNLELSDDIEKDYDALCESGLLEKILRTFESEYKEILSLLQMQCDYILMDNSITSKVNTLLTAATVAVNKFGDSATDVIKHIKPEDIKGLLNLIK